ncbi:GolD/DthD family dehydrogenase [Paenibacillus bovis]|uniref:D-threitol dehydrogenase n=1 Tax=Paenibacillus bovis TaxID=1616788 RepID=A0A172ZGV0_9BACL|nr:D-threitol dehydrogenase [Paenibacillus bovis]ANF96759.1 D-threitol dehydrogenase [Paenibacillus bovis]
MNGNLYDTTFRLDGKTAVITGAASGIGLATAQLFAEKGASVALLDLHLEQAQRAAEGIEYSAAFEVNVADSESVRKAITQVQEKLGHIDILVNSAGIGPVEWAEDYPEADWHRTMEVNMNGMFFMSQQVGREMIAAQQGGKIISLASQAGIVAIDRHVAYSASKAAVISITRSLAHEWGKHNIQVNAISPTATYTPLITGYWEGEIKEEAIRNTPVGRFAEPGEIAAAALFLASGSANMITGANLVVDGGYTIH